MSRSKLPTSKPARGYGDQGARPGRDSFSGSHSRPLSARPTSFLAFSQKLYNYAKLHHSDHRHKSQFSGNGRHNLEIGIFNRLHIRRQLPPSSSHRRETLYHDHRQPPGVRFRVRQTGRTRRWPVDQGTPGVDAADHATDYRRRADQDGTDAMAHLGGTTAHEVEQGAAA